MNFSDFLRRPFPYLDHSRHRWILILFFLAFGVLFINIFVPFNINHWNADSGLSQFFRLSGFGIIPGIVILITQFGIRSLTGISRLTTGTFLIFFFVEILLMATAFILYQSYRDISLPGVLRDLPDSLKYTLPGITMAYSMVLLYIAKITANDKEPGGKYHLAHCINFLDENSNVRYSIASEQILFLESADNYVMIYHCSDLGLEKKLLRNSMKNTEKMLESARFKRCHRSYIVNLDKIEFVKYERSQCRIKLSGYAGFIPVSRKFFPAFRSMINT
jgi:hypothetical protein